MPGIRIVTDSASDLPAELVASHGIVIVPLDVRLDKWGPDEMRLIDPAEFWRRCATTEELPETSAPSPGAFADAFTALADDGATGVVCVTLSSDLSATYQAARAGADEVRDRIEVRVVDSRFVTLGEGFVVLEAAAAAEAGKDLAEVEASARDLVKSVRVVGTLDTLDNLKKGGRIGSAQAALGSLLSIKPIIEVRDGVVEQLSRQRTRARSIDFLVDLVKNQGNLTGLAVAHAAAPDLDVFLDKLGEIYPRDEILVSYIGPVIGTHAGPGTIGICTRVA